MKRKFFTQFFSGVMDILPYYLISTSIIFFVFYDNIKLKPEDVFFIFIFIMIFSPILWLWLLSLLQLKKKNLGYLFFKVKIINFDGSKANFKRLYWRNCIVYWFVFNPTFVTLIPLIFLLIPADRKNWIFSWDLWTKTKAVIDGIEEGIKEEESEKRRIELKDKWGFKIYNKYKSSFLICFLVFFILFVMIFLTMTTLSWNKENNLHLYGFFSYGLFTIILLSILIFTGLIQYSVDLLFLGQNVLWLSEDGIYGCKFFIAGKPQLLAKWEEIEEITLKKYPMSIKPAFSFTGYAVLKKKDGKVFHIGYFGIFPASDEKRVSLEKICYTGTNVEFFALIACKIGLERFKNFPLEDGMSKEGRRKNSLSIEAIRKMVDQIDTGKESNERNG